MNHQEKKASNENHEAGPTTRRGAAPELMGADTLIGNDVYNLEGDDFGNIKEIMLDMRSGRIIYAVLSFKPFLGLGDKLFAVPWRALTLDSGHKRFTLDVDKNRLKDAPGFDNSHWPDMADQHWQSEISRFYGSKGWE
ncbi:PRC-barrel domain containing protein [Pseudomonas sp. BN417]|uniref:PRC-barrel domain-containing protein n=1 Tax=Pseudomonas sp. BN417 TaxID=2567890 RepID=UPI002456CE62|nr:PRC-barrel domain-containing protein [Pseudomonas sp. BN417]MDH4559175.1 PRC-barrel domain containing protein [Pseudomonas sp. BN417]